MGTITGIFDGAKESIRQGKTNIRQSVSGLGGLEISAGHEPFNKEGSNYGKKWSSDLNDSGFDVLSDPNKVEGTVVHDGLSDTTITWDFPEPQSGLEINGNGNLGTEGTVETEPDSDDGSWLKNNPFD